MKKKILTLTLTLGILFCTTMPTMAQTREINFPDLRTAKGTYYDYLTITTEDGNEWLLDDSADSKYIDSNGTAIFQNGESVIVLFDTMATENITDDVILDVHSLEY